MAQPRSAGRSGSRWRRLHAEQKAKRLGCWICGQPIDYTLHWRNPGSFSVDHAEPLSKRRDLAEDPANLRSAHRRCNMSKGDKAHQPSIGTTSRTW